MQIGEGFVGARSNREVDGLKGHESIARLQPIGANLMRCPSMGEWLLSRRDRLIVARHEVPGKASFERTVP